MICSSEPQPILSKDSARREKIRSLSYLKKMQMVCGREQDLMSDAILYLISIKKPLTEDRVQAVLEMLTQKSAIWIS